MDLSKTIEELAKEQEQKFFPKAPGEQQGYEQDKNRPAVVEPALPPTPDKPAN